jgi:hypothetical protein
MDLPAGYPARVSGSMAWVPQDFDQWENEVVFTLEKPDVEEIEGALDGFKGHYLLCSIARFHTRGRG